MTTEQEGATNSSGSDTCSLEDEGDSPGFSSTLKQEFRKDRDSEEEEEVEPRPVFCPVPC